MAAIKIVAVVWGAGLFRADKTGTEWRQNVRAIHGGKRFYRVDQTGWHRHVARAVFRAVLQHRADAACAGDLPRTPPAGDEAHALGFDSVLGER